MAGSTAVATREPTTSKRIGIAILLLAIVLVIALLGSLASTSHVDGWYADAEKVPWNPPNAVFGPVWSALYLAIAYAGWMIWNGSYVSEAGLRARARLGAERQPARAVLLLYGIQLALNAAWTPIFFAGYPLLGAVAWWLAAAVILALIVVVVLLMVAARPWSTTASWIMLPYLAWLLFAASLNLGIIALN